MTAAREVTVHDEDRDCWCQPTIVPGTDEGADGPCVVVHNDTMDDAAEQADRAACVFVALSEIADSWP